MTTVTQTATDELSTQIGKLVLRAEEEEGERSAAATEEEKASIEDEKKAPEEATAKVPVKEVKSALAPMTEDSPEWLKTFHEEGYAIIEDVITQAQAKQYISDWHTWLEGFPLGYKRDDKSTWTQDHLPLNFKGGVFFLYNAAHEAVAWRARSEPKVVDAFAKLWGTDHLIVSFDSPNVTHAIGPAGRTDTEVLAPWPHVDADPLDYDYCLPQGFLNFEESGDNDGGLVILTKSRHLHVKFIEERGIIEEQRQGRDQWYHYSPEDVQWFLDQGSELIKVNVPPGALVVWDSRTVHWTRSPTGDRTRVLQYLCYEPDTHLTEEARKIKVDHFNRQLTTSHNPHLNIAPQLLAPAPIRNGVVDPAHITKPFHQPDLTDQVLRLAGAKRYEKQEGRQEAASTVE